MHDSTVLGNRFVPVFGMRGAARSWPETPFAQFACEDRHLPTLAVATAANVACPCRCGWHPYLAHNAQLLTGLASFSGGLPAIYQPKRSKGASPGPRWHFGLVCSQKILPHKPAELLTVSKRPA